MKAFRGEPSIFVSPQPENRRAELEVKKIYLGFGGVMALLDIDLTVHTGELVSIIGPNGAGKTSLLNCITGYYHPQRGQMLFNGEEITGLHPHEITKKGIGRTFQNIELFPRMTVLANMLLARHIYCDYGIGNAMVFSRSVRQKEDMVRFLIELNSAWGQTMILVEHDMSVVMSISQRIMVLNFGEKIAEGTPGVIQSHPEVIKAYLGDTTKF